jgi:hypothetical protein
MGEIVSGYEIRNDTVFYDFTVPFGTTAKLCLPLDLTDIKIDGKDISAINKADYKYLERDVYIFGSGRYRLTAAYFKREAKSIIPQ